MSDFTVKDSGKRTEFATGSRRDTEDDKLDWTLLAAFYPALIRDVRHLMKGAAKYDRHNWRKGQSLARAERSMWRHLTAYMNGERDEDHLAALRFNASLIQDHEARIAAGELPASLDDRDEWRRMPAFVEDDELTLAETLEANSCYFPEGEGGIKSPHVEDSARGAGCVGCGISREDAAFLGQEFMA